MYLYNIYNSTSSHNIYYILILSLLIHIIFGGGLPFFFWVYFNWYFIE